MSCHLAPTMAATSDSTSLPYMPPIIRAKPFTAHSPEPTSLGLVQESGRQQGGRVSTNSRWCTPLRGEGASGHGLGESVSKSHTNPQILGLDRFGRKGPCPKTRPQNDKKLLSLPIANSSELLKSKLPWRTLPSTLALLDLLSFPTLLVHLHVTL